MPFIPVLAKRAKKKIKYLLRATFDADDIAFVDDQVLDTAAEMGAGFAGQLTVVEDDGTLAIVLNRCAFTVQGTPTWGDQGFYSQAITRALGRGLLWAENISGAGTDLVGFWPNTGLSATVEYVMRLYAGAAETQGLGIRERATWLIRDIATSASTDYQLAIVLGGYDAANGVPWRSGQAAASYLYGAAFFIKGGVFTNWTLLWRASQLNTATLYAAFSNYDAAGNLDDFKIADKDLSAVLQPNNLSTMGSTGELSAYTPDVGGVWAEDIGDWDTDSTSLVATTLGIATFTGLADCLYDAKITMPGSGTTAGGLVLRETDLTGASEDYWYVKVTPGTAGTDWELIEYVAGTPTQRASGDVDWSVSTAYAIRAICDGQDIACFADSGDKISYASAASGETATSFGLRDEGNANMTFDNVALFARTSSVYDAALDSV